MSAHAYRALDYRLFAGIAAGFGPTGLGSGYLGTYEDGAIIQPAPAPSSSRREPTFWGRWGYQYTSDPATTLDPEGAVVRYGILLLAARIQPGGDLNLIKGPAGLWEQWCDRCATFNDNPTNANAAPGVTIFTESRDDNHGLSAGWMLYSLQLRFTLTA